MCGLVQTNQSGREKETFQCHLVTYSLLQSMMIAGVILIFFNLISSLAVVHFTKKKPERVAAKTETKFPYLTAAVNPDNVKTSKYPLEKYKTPGKQMSRAWIRREAEFEAKKEAKVEQAAKKDELSSAEERLDASQQENYHQVLKIEELEDKEETVENLVSNMETQRKYHLDKDADLRNAQDRIKELEKKIASIEDTKSREITNIRSDLEGKCRSLANLQKVLDETKQELMVKEQDSDNFMNNLTDASSALGGLKVDLAEAKDNIETLETKLEQVILFSHRTILIT